MLSKVRELRPDLGLTVSATTREPRAGEVDASHITFLSEAEFRQRIAQGEFLEWLMCMDTFMERFVKMLIRFWLPAVRLFWRLMYKALSMFVRAIQKQFSFLSHRLRWKNLKGVLRMRGSETKESMALRLADAAHEFELAKNYDVVITNDDLDRAVSELIKTIRSFEMK